MFTGVEKELANLVPAAASMLVYLRLTMAGLCDISVNVEDALRLRHAAADAAFWRGSCIFHWKNLVRVFLVLSEMHLALEHPSKAEKCRRRAKNLASRFLANSDALMKYRYDL